MTHTLFFSFFVTYESTFNNYESFFPPRDEKNNQKRQLVIKTHNSKCSQLTISNSDFLILRSNRAILGLYFTIQNCSNCPKRKL